MSRPFAPRRFRPTPFLSKSKFMNGLQCAKLLWYAVNRKEELPPPDGATQALFDAGHDVGALAWRLFPDGRSADTPGGSFRERIQATQDALSARRPVFEAALTAESCYAQVDILAPADGAAWDIVEVKSSTGVKDEHKSDVAFQRQVCEAAGVRIARCRLMHIDKTYVRRGEIAPEAFFDEADITGSVAKLTPGIRARRDEMFRVMAAAEAPNVPIGVQCTSPYECPLIGLCWKDHTAPDSIVNLHRGNERCFELLRRGILRIQDIPDDVELTEKQAIQREVLRSGVPRIDTRAVRRFLNALEYPLHYLDFETLGPAIPLYDGTRPFQQVPFQFSLSVVGKPGMKPEHHGYIAPGDVDPRPGILSRLKELLGDRGSIVAYHAPFEMGCLADAVAEYPEYGSWYRAGIEPRFRDLLHPFREFAYHHPGQEGSASLKNVLPALTGTSYEGMEIADGGAASREYLRVTRGSGRAGGVGLLPGGDNRTLATEEDRRKVFAALEVYCRQDTDAMIEIVRVLEDAAGAPAGGKARARGEKANVSAADDRPEPEPPKAAEVPAVSTNLSEPAASGAQPAVAAVRLPEEEPKDAPAPADRPEPESPKGGGLKRRGKKSDPDAAQQTLF